MSLTELVESQIGDLDEVFAYRTSKVSNILDRWLGLLKYTIDFAVIVYVIGICLVKNEGYLRSEPGFGIAQVTMVGNTFMILDGAPFALDDIQLRYSGLSNGAIIYTKKVITMGQKIGNCSNIEGAPCVADVDCPIQPPLRIGKCEDKGCRELGWCPHQTIDPETLGTKDKTSSSTQYFMEGVEDLEVRINSTVSFPSHGSLLYETFNSKGSEVKAKLTLASLLKMGKTTVEEVRDKGGIFVVRLEWMCQVGQGQDCSPKMSVSRVDNQEGFAFREATYYKDGDKEMRDYCTNSAIRLFISVKGVAQNLDSGLIMLQVSVAMALLQVSELVVDFIMQTVLSERNHYRTFKEEVSPDFSDLRAKVALIEKDAGNSDKKP